MNITTVGYSVQSRRNTSPPHFSASAHDIVGACLSCPLKQTRQATDRQRLGLPWVLSHCVSQGLVTSTSRPLKSATFLVATDKS